MAPAGTISAGSELLLVFEPERWLTDEDADKEKGFGLGSDLVRPVHPIDRLETPIRKTQEFRTPVSLIADS